MHFVPIKIGHALILYYAKRHVLQFCSTYLLPFLIISMPSVLTSISSHPLRWPPSTSFFPSKYGISSLGTIQKTWIVDPQGQALSNGSEVSIGCSDAIATRCASCIESESHAPQFEQNLAWSGILVPQFLQYIIYISLPEILSLGKENSPGEFSRSSSRSFHHRYKSKRDCPQLLLECNPSLVETYWGTCPLYYTRKKLARLVMLPRK